MPYILEVCKAGKIIEVRKYFTYRYNKKGERRNKKSNKTTNTQEKVNLRQASMKLRRKLNCNFQDGDYLVTYDYRKEERPNDSREMTGHMSSFLKKLRREYKKLGVELKYIYVKELGPRGAAHIHMVMNSIPKTVEILMKCWTHGGVDIKPLNTDGQYEKIAEYFVKYADKTIKTEGKLVGKKFYPSRNLNEPVVRKKVIWKSNAFRTTVKIEKGYYLEKDSVAEGVNQCGYQYFSYSLHKLQERKTERKKE